MKADKEEEEVILSKDLELLKTYRDLSLPLDEEEGEQEDQRSLAIQIHKLKQEFDKQKLLDKTQIETSTQRIAELEEENRLLRAQQDNLKTLYHSTQETLEETKNKKDSFGSTLTSLNDEKNRLELMLKELRLHTDQLEKGMQYLRAKAEEGRTEANQLAVELAHAQDRILDLEKELHSAKSHSEMTSRMEKEKTEALLAREQMLSGLQQELYQLHDALRTTRIQAEEREGQLKIAQQHLAKKVRESALLSEKSEEQKNLLMESQRTVEMLQEKLSETENLLTAHQAQEKRQQELLLEAEKSIETQSQRWEEKYFKLYDRWMEAETQNKELRKLEEKQNQMQVLLSSLNNLLASSKPIPPLSKENQDIDPTQFKKNLFE